MPTDEQLRQQTAYNRETCATKDCTNAACRELPHRYAKPTASPGDTSSAKPIIVTTLIGYCDPCFRREVAKRMAAKTAP